MTLPITITVGNSFSYISRAFNTLPDYLQNQFIKELSYEKRLNQKSRNIYLLFKNPSANGDLNYYYKMPTGLLHRFWKMASVNNLKLNFVDRRNETGEILPVENFFRHLKKADPDLEERDYQINAIQRCLTIKRGVIEHSTAAGKSLIAAGVLYCLNRKSLVLCIGKEHINQLSKDIEIMTGRKVSVVGGGSSNFSGQIVVSTIQSLDAFHKRDPAAYQDQMSKFKCVIGDEIHHCGSDSYKEAVYFCVNAKYKLGFSGTVFREDGAVLEIEAAIGPVIDKKDYSYLQKNNYIVQAKFFFVDPLCRPLMGADNYWPDCLQAGIVHSTMRNELIAKASNIYVQKGLQVLIITPFRVEHGMILQNLIPGSRFMFGESGDMERKQTLKDFRAKKFMVLIGSKIYDEIINLPDVRAVVLAGGGKAHNSFFQRIGRGIRKAEGKTHVEIVIPWDSHSSVLLRHSKSIRTYINSVETWKPHLKFIGSHREKHPLTKSGNE